jgi:hypothetical protein
VKTTFSIFFNLSILCEEWLSILSRGILIILTIYAAHQEAVEVDWSSCLGTRSCDGGVPGAARPSPPPPPYTQPRVGRGPLAEAVEEWTTFKGIRRLRSPGSDYSKEMGTLPIPLTSSEYSGDITISVRGIPTSLREPSEKRPVSSESVPGVPGFLPAVWRHSVYLWVCICLLNAFAVLTSESRQLKH